MVRRFSIIYNHCMVVLEIVWTVMEVFFDMAYCVLAFHVIVHGVTALCMITANIQASTSCFSAVSELAPTSSAVSYTIQSWGDCCFRTVNLLTSLPSTMCYAMI